MMRSKTQNRKNVLGSRTDIGWEYGEEVDNDSRKIKCRFCKEIILGNVFRFKHHLACTKKDVKACKSVPDEVIKQMRRVLDQQKSSKRKSMNDEEEEMVDLRDEAGKLFCTSGIPFSCAKNRDYAKKLELVGKCDSKFVAPSYQEFENSSLEKKRKTTTVVHEKYRFEWKKGCSIICDEWTNMRGRSCCKFFVNSPMGNMFLRSIDTSDFSEMTVKVFEALDKIVEEVGEENVIQVITNNDANYKVAMEMLIEKRKMIFWSPCVVQLLDGILKNFENNLSHQIIIDKGKKISTFICSRTIVMFILRMFTGGKDLSRPEATQSAKAYLTLLSLIDMKDSLIAMFSSEQWKSNELAMTKEGEEIQQIVMDDVFWIEIVDCLNFALPIIEVLVKIYSDEKPNMGFIYKEMNCAKDSLQSLNNVKRCELIQKTINEIWIAQLHQLYVASYLLNPQLLFNPTFNFPSEINEEPSTYLARMVNYYDGDLSMNAEKLKKIEGQVVDFFKAQGLFGSKAAILERNTKDPAKWWDSYGKHCPELQRLAIRLLSLTCSSCGSGQSWNASKQVYLKKRSHLYQKKPNDSFLLIQNFKTRTDEPKLKDFGALMQKLPSDNELITAKEVPQVSGAYVLTDMVDWSSLNTPETHIALYTAVTENHK
ncbi:uncharacterized protein LOC122009670 [Zingiber officinale]|uniref:uncharacterized protein LOC122009670 n=1 Tax=Zingiber officinale TaxID=94328 RepID=UPI001C4C3734|nr:uncharacterized protein LOC122009670 [Zingiber officinale]